MAYLGKSNDKVTALEKELLAAKERAAKAEDQLVQEKKEKQKLLAENQRLKEKKSSPTLFGRALSKTSVNLSQEKPKEDTRGKCWCL